MVVLVGLSIWDMGIPPSAVAMIPIPVEVA